MIGFVAGIFVGVAIGISATAICVSGANRERDERYSLDMKNIDRLVRTIKIDGKEQKLLIVPRGCRSLRSKLSKLTSKRGWLMPSERVSNERLFEYRDCHSGDVKRMAKEILELHADIEGRKMAHLQNMLFLRELGIRFENGADGDPVKVYNDRAITLTESLKLANELLATHNLAVCDKHATAWKLDAMSGCPDCEAAHG